MRYTQRRRIFVLLLSVLMITVLDVISPLPSSFLFVPLFFLVDQSNNSLVKMAPLIRRYVTSDLTPALVFGLFQLGVFVYLLTRVVPVETSNVFVYALSFLIVSCVLRVTIELTTLLYRESAEVAVECLYGFAVSRLTFFATPIILTVATPGVDISTALFAMVFWGIVMVPQFMKIRWLGPWSSSRPLLRYLLADEAVNFAVGVFKRLQWRGQSEVQLVRALHVPQPHLVRCLSNLQHRRLLIQHRSTWYLSRDQARVVRLARKREFAKRQVEWPDWLE